MLIDKSSIIKSNKLTVEFIAKMAMLVMVKLRNKESEVKGYLPVPVGLEDTNKQNEVLYNVILNIIKNELKINPEDLEKPIEVKETSYILDVDMFKVTKDSIDHSEISTVLGDKLMFNITYIKDVILKTIKDFAENVNNAKVAYEVGKTKSNFRMIPIGVPAIIDYKFNKGDYAGLDNNSVKIPDSGSTTQADIINWNEVTEKDLRNDLLSYFEFNKNEVYDFLSLFMEGEVLTVARNYLSILNNNNNNLIALSILTINNYNNVYLLSLISEMLLNTTKENNAPLSVLNTTFKALSAKALAETKNFINNKILVTYLDNNKIYVVDEVFSAAENLDNIAIVGAALNRNIKDSKGTAIISLEDVNLNKDNYLAVYKQYEITKQLEVETGMKGALINIFMIESKNILNTIPAEVRDNLNLTDLSIASIVSNYVTNLNFENISNILDVCKDIVLNHIFKDEVANKFISYYYMYSKMNNSLTSQDCALLAGASLVVLELGSNFTIKEDTPNI